MIVPVTLADNYRYNRRAVHLVVFHYHLLPGGVTDVIIHSIAAVVEHRPDISSVQVVCGREPGAREATDRLAGLGVPVALDVVGDLDYTSPAETTESGLARAKRLEHELTERYAGNDALWWIHNFHVGKNPAFTLAVCRIACAPDHRNERPQRMVLHIHDFPECARYENLAYLNRIAGESPYPAGPAVQYVVINGRDFSLMQRTGVPAGRIHLLVNPLPAATGADRRGASRDVVVSALDRFASDNGQRFDPERPVLLYPVRTIRRKNVLEAALLARLADDANLVVTLPGVSGPERPYSDLVSRAYANGAAHGVWGIGRQEKRYGISFDDLTHAADTVVSSSVQEGFGLLFVNALRWGVPMFARHLSVLEGLSTIFTGYPARFYTDVRVPTGSPSVTSPRAYLRMRYAERLNALGGVLPPSARSRVERQLEAIIGEQSIDFSLLPPDLQFPVLGDLADPGFAADVRALNAPAIADLEAVQRAWCPDMTEEVNRSFGFAAFAERFSRVVEACDRPSAPEDRDRAGVTDIAGCPRYGNAQETLLREFADIEFLRLLFAPMGHDHG